MRKTIVASCMKPTKQLTNRMEVRLISGMFFRVRKKAIRPDMTVPVQKMHSQVRTFHWCLYYHSVFEKTATHFSNLKVFVCSLCQLFPYLWIRVCLPWQNIFSRLLEFNTTSYTKHHFLSDLYQQSTFNEWLFGEMTAPVFVGNVILSDTIPDCLLSFPCSSFLLTVHTNYS